VESLVGRGLHELARANQKSHRIQMLQDSLLSIKNAILILDEMVENGTTQMTNEQWYCLNCKSWRQSKKQCKKKNRNKGEEYQLRFLCHPNVCPPKIAPRPQKTPSSREYGAGYPVRAQWKRIHRNSNRPPHHASCVKKRSVTQIGIFFLTKVM